MARSNGAACLPVWGGVDHFMIQPPMLGEVLLGAQNVAVTEWNTRMFVVLLVTGQWERGGVPSNVGFCS